MLIMRGSTAEFAEYERICAWQHYARALSKPLGVCSWNSGHGNAMGDQAEGVPKTRYVSLPYTKD